MIQPTVSPKIEKDSASVEQCSLGVSRESNREIEPTVDEVTVQEERSLSQGIELSSEETDPLFVQAKEVAICKQIVDDDPRQILDREKIEEKIADLPNGIRDVLEEKFKADFVSIEKIDETKLI